MHRMWKGNQHLRSLRRHHRQRIHNRILNWYREWHYGDWPGCFDAWVWTSRNGIKRTVEAWSWVDDRGRRRINKTWEDVFAWRKHHSYGYLHNRKPCSCSGCGNPRKHFKKKTLQEKRAEISFEEQLQEIA